MAFQTRNSASPRELQSTESEDSKIDQRSVNNYKKGYKRNTQITNNQNHPQNNLY